MTTLQPRRNLQKYQSRNPLQQLLIRRFQLRVEATLAGLPDGALLDAGCGEGFILQRLAAAKLFGVDVEHEPLRFARALSGRANLARASVLALPFPEVSFPVVLCLEVLEHLPEPQRAVAELHRVSAGHLVVSVPHEPWFRLANLARGKNLSRWGDDVEHVNHWGPEGFRRLLGGSFAKVRVETSFPWLIAVAER